MRYGSNTIRSFEWVAKSIEPKVAIVIPARLESTRLPRKLLLNETGKSVLQHTYEAACKAQVPSRVIVAADDRLLADEVEQFGGEVVMTDPNAACGTDRVAEVAKAIPEFDVIINVQGDEPDVSPQAIDEAANLLIKDEFLQMATLATPIESHEQLADPACVKVVLDVMNRALYFSRSPIPYGRDQQGDISDDQGPICFQHVGLYAYRRDFLLQFSQMAPSRLEQFEGLEQLRVLEAGIDIRVAIVNERSFGIDTPEDYQRFVASKKAA